MKRLDVWESLQLHLVDVCLVDLEVVVLVEAGSDSREVKVVALEKNVFQLLRHFLAALVQQLLLSLAHQRLPVFVERVKYQVAAISSYCKESVGP